MSRYHLSDPALLDLDAIWQYIARDNPRAADHFMADILGNIAELADSPHAGRERPELGAGLRSVPHGRYLIFYRATSDGIEVVRVVHGARNLREVGFDDD